MNQRLEQQFHDNHHGDLNIEANIGQLDHILPNGPLPTSPGRSQIRADAFAHELGAVELDTARDHHLALAMAVIEFAVDAGAPLPWSHDDPTVALLRAAAKLSLTAPHATSSAAADLVERLREST